MPSNCCITGCKNSNKNSFHLFRFPLNRPDILQMWINAIGREGFQPTKNHLICSAHFKAEDYMDRPNTSGVRLKNLAVPSIFSKVSAPAFIPNITDYVTNSPAASSSAKTWRSILKKPIKDIDQLSPNVDSESSSTSSLKHTPIVLSESPKATTSANSIDDTIKITTVKKRKIMDPSVYYLKMQKMSPRKQRMQRTIKSLRQKVSRREEKIRSLESLLKTLRYNDKV
ncbi:THAP domain-containing protein 1 isoform X1 [Solenopsis invicta]|uniref:THAP domain-containing protein 1 isoform X1 n=1 Tax=Solenopsis invicta TaxID=13686 RepID=UPI00193E30A3|nr:THAP domain-containing protein 1 isoform X1 [Solenopsis invicta]